MAEQSLSSSTEHETSQKSSVGLSRWLGFFGVLAFGMAGLGLSRSSNFPLEIIPGRWPGINMVVVVAIALAAGLLFTFAFSAIGAIVRRPAADYVLASRLIHPAPAFASSWTFVITLALFAGSVAGSVAVQIVPNFFKTLGTVFGMQDLLAQADTTASGQVAVLVGTVIVVVAFLIMTLPPRTISGLLRIGFVLVLLSWVVLLLQLLAAQGTSFASGYDGIFGSGTYNQHIELAYQYGLDTQPPKTGIMLVVGLFSGFYLFFGASLSAQASSEVEKPGKSLIPGSVTSLLMAGVITLAGILLLQKVVPIQFLAAQSYLSQKQVEVSGLVLSWLPFYAAVARPLLGLVLVVGISWLYLLFLLVLVLMVVISRIVLAWARDGLIPARIAYILPRQQTPLLAVFIAAIAIQIGVIDAVQGGALMANLHFALFISVSQLLPVAALVLYPLLGEKGKVKISLMPVQKILISLVGLFTLGYLVWTIISLFAYPFHLQEIRQGTFILLIVCLASGLTWYGVRWWLLRRKGVDLTEKFRSLPAEE